MNKILIGLVIVLVAIVGVIFPIQKTSLSGTIHSVQEIFKGGIDTQDLIQGGGIVTKTAGTTVAWSASDVCDNSIITWAPTVTSALSTTTIPTAASIISKCLKENGDFKDIIFYNNGTYASNTVSFVMGTGVTAFIPEATEADKIVEGLNTAEIRFTRMSDTTVKMAIKEQLVQ
jgi:hypothetical protein